jgi:hypothetical protein
LDPAIKADTIKKERKVKATEKAADNGKGEETGSAVEGGVAVSGTLAKVGWPEMSSIRHFRIRELNHNIRQKMLYLKKNYFLQKFCVKILFCKHYFSPLNTFMKKGRIQEAQKHPDSDPQLCEEFFTFLFLFISVKCKYSIKYEKCSVSDPWHFGVDPDPDLDPRIHASD